MVRTNNLLLSTLALSTCCVAPTIGFAPEAPTSRLSHVRLDLAESSPSAAIGNNGPLSSIDVVDDDQISSIGGGSDLPPVLQQITDERRNFQMNLGKAMDTLRKDMPYILKKTPDYSIYHDDITVVDPSGVQLTGMDNYKSSIKFFQQFVSFWFQPEQNGIQYRLVMTLLGRRSAFRGTLSLSQKCHLENRCTWTESVCIVSRRIRERLLSTNSKIYPLTTPQSCHPTESSR